MSLSNIELIQTQDGDVNQLQINIKKAFTPIINNGFLGGALLSSVNLTSGNNNINTGLNQTLQGWVVVDKNGAAQIYRNQGSVDPTKILVLNSSAAVTVTLYVF